MCGCAPSGGLLDVRIGGRPGLGADAAACLQARVSQARKHAEPEGKLTLRVHAVACVREGTCCSAGVAGSCISWHLQA